MMQKDLTIEEAKNIALPRLSALVDISENLDSAFPGKGFLNSAIKLSLISAKLKRSSKPVIQDSEFNDLQQFATNLIEFDSNLKPKLRQWWDLYHGVIDALKETNGLYDLQGVINTLTQKIEQSDALSVSVTKEAKLSKSTILFPASLLLVHVIRVESIEYAIREQLDDAITKFGLNSKFDVAEMCSVEHKVQKGNKWNSDVRAIRDATAHGQFKITLAADNEWSIEFKNNEGGYNYQKTFSRMEFQRFFNQHSLLYKFQLSLWNILELLILIATYFSK